MESPKTTSTTNECQKDYMKTITDYSKMTYIVTLKLATIKKNINLKFIIPPGPVVYFSKPAYRVWCIVTFFKLKIESHQKMGSNLQHNFLISRIYIWPYQ